jgi:hypothetical protein
MDRRKTIRAGTGVIVGVALCMTSGVAPDRVRSVTGTITEFRLGDWVAIKNEQFMPFPLALRDETVYENEDFHTVVDPSIIEPGMRATVWYRNVGERRLVVDRIRVSEETRLP